MIQHYSFANISSKSDLQASMYVDRKRVFVDALKWDLHHEHGEERDEFDDRYAQYLVLQDSQGDHKASVRLLPTSRPHILGNIFPFLCEGNVPRGKHILEITRYIASPRFRAAERVRARNMMARALIEFGLLNRIEMYTAVCDISFLNQILAAGWRCEPLGLPQKVNGSQIGAFAIHVETEAIKSMVPCWRYDACALSTDTTTNSEQSIRFGGRK